MGADHLGIWSWMVNDGDDVRAAGTRLQDTATMLGRQEDRLRSTLGSASTALGWKGQIVDRADQPASTAQTQIARFAEDLQAAGTALRDLASAMDTHAPQLRQVRIDWQRLQDDPPMRDLGLDPLDDLLVDRGALREAEAALRRRAEGLTEALSTADRTCRELLAGVVESVRGLVPLGTSPDFLRSLIPTGAYGVFAEHGVADTPAERALADRILQLADTPEAVRKMLAEVPVERLAEFLSRHPEIAAALANDWDHRDPDPLAQGLLDARGDLGPHGQLPDGVEDVHAYWASLTDLEQEQLRLLYPTLVGNTDGIPLPDRAMANRALMMDALRKELTVEAMLAAAPTSQEEADQRREDAAWYVPGFWHDVNDLWDDLNQGPGQFVRRTEHPDLLLEESRQRVALYEQMLYDEPVVLRPDLPGLPGDQRMVILFDPRSDGRFAEYSGKLDAENVSVIVPGTGNDMAGMKDYNERFAGIAADHPDDTAVITWLGGDMPDAIGADAPKNSYTSDNGHRLVTFVEGLRTVGEAEWLTLVGHSAGGAVVGFADKYGVEADAVLHVASAGTGTGISDASMYPSHTWAGSDGPEREVQRFSQTAPGDPIIWAQRAGQIDDALDKVGLGLPEDIGHGYNPDTTPGFTSLDTGVWLVDTEARGGSFEAGDLLEGTLSHDYVIRPGTTSWQNIIGVIRADWDSVVER